MQQEATTSGRVILWRQLAFESRPEERVQQVQVWRSGRLEDDVPSREWHVFFVPCLGAGTCMRGSVVHDAQKIVNGLALTRYHRFPTWIDQPLSNYCSHNPSPLESSNNNKMCVWMCVMFMWLWPWLWLWLFDMCELLLCLWWLLLIRAGRRRPSPLPPPPPTTNHPARPGLGRVVGGWEGVWRGGGEGKGAV